MSSTIDHRPPGRGPDDPTGRFAAIPPVPFGGASTGGPVPGAGGPRHTGAGPGPTGPMPGQAGPMPGVARPMHGPAGPVPGPPGPVGPMPAPAGPVRGRTGPGAAPFTAHPGYGWPAPHPGHLPPGGPAAGTRPRRGWIPAVLVGAFVLLAAIGGLASAARTTTVPGSVTLHVTYSSLTSGSSCTGAGLFSWLDANTTPVTIYGADGAVVGTTTIGSGTAYATGNGWSSSYADTCVFPFTLTDVPADEDFYRVKVGTGSGDGVTFTGAELRSGGAHVEYGRDGS